MKTRAELVTLVLEDLGVLAAGQTAQIEDTRRVDELAPSIIETLRATEVYYLNDIENIPEEVFVPLSNIVAWGCRNKFGVSDPDELTRMQEAATAANTALKTITRGRPTYAPLKTEFF